MSVHQPHHEGSVAPAPAVALALSSFDLPCDRLAAMLGVDTVVPAAQATADDAVRMLLCSEDERNIARITAYAASMGVPVHTVAPGWLLSSRARYRPEFAYSIRLDWQNLQTWLDGEGPSQLTACELDYARDCRRQMIDAHISRYNYYRQADATASTVQPRVMVVDETSGTVPQTLLLAMLDAAMAENPGARIQLRADSAGTESDRQSALEATARARGIEVLDARCDPIAQIAQASRVYTCTSWLGYEAVLMQKQVTVFANPFYAGRGLTDDRGESVRVGRRCTVDALFHATHVRFSRYANPITGDGWQLHQCLAHIALQKQWFGQNAHRFRAVGITPWKRGYIRQYLRSPDGELLFASRGIADRKSGEDVIPVTWGYRRFAGLSDGTVTRIEDGFLRSLGLGSDFNAPSSLVVDRSGMYFDPASGSELERLLNCHDCSETQLIRASALKKLILSAGLSKYNLGTRGKSLVRPVDKNVILVVGQVEDDQSIQRGCDAIRTNAALLLAVRERAPDAHVRYKPHPDVVAGNRRGEVPSTVLDRCVDELVENASIVDSIETCDELHTMTSLSGFEALLRGKRVVTYGSPFYAGWGLTDDLQPLAGRKRKRSLDELVYLALIAYPRYVDIDTGEFMTPEDLVIKINKQFAMSKNTNRRSWSGRQWNKAVNIVRGISYAP